MNEYLVDLYCRDLETANSDLLRISQLLNDLAQRCGASFTCRWARQRARNGLSFELRIYAASSRETARSIALTLAEELRRLGYGAHVRPRDTFVIVRKGKEKLAAILHRLGLLTNLYTSDMPPRVRKRIEEALHELEGSIKICEVPEEKLHEFYTDLLNKINEEYQKLLEKHRDSKTALEKLQEKYHDLYIKLPHDLDTLRRKLQEKKDYITWLTITDGITSIIVDHNVDTLQYGTTRPELLTIVTKALGIVKIHITTPDNKTNKPHIVATHNNYIIHKIYGKYIPETDQIIQNIREIMNRAKEIISTYLRNNYDITCTKLSEINRILKTLYKDGKLTYENISRLAKDFVTILQNYVKDLIDAFAGAIDGDGVLDKHGPNDYCVGISFAPFTVKGFCILSLMILLQAKGLASLGSLMLDRYTLRLWITNKARKKLVEKVTHPTRLRRLQTLCKRSLSSLLEPVNLRSAIEAFERVIEYLDSVGGRLSAHWCLRRNSRNSCLLLRLKVQAARSSSEVASQIANILRSYEIGARHVPKSSIIEVKKGKIELAYVLHEHGLLNELIPREASDYIKKIVRARLDELEEQKRKYSRGV